MRSSAVRLTLLIVIIFFILCSKFAMAEQYPDVHSLFYVSSATPPLTLILIIQLALIGIVLLGLANAFFDWKQIEYRLKLIEAFVVEKLTLEKTHPPTARVDSVKFLSSLKEEKLFFGNEPLQHRGVYVLESKEPNVITRQIIALMQEIVEKWQRPVLYSGRKESGLLANILKSPYSQKEELKRYSKLFSGYLYILPALIPYPELIYRSALKLKGITQPCAILLEDVGCIEMVRQFSKPENLHKLNEISAVLNAPIFIITATVKDGILKALKENPKAGSELLNIGEIKIGKHNEIYIARKEKV